MPTEDKNASRRDQVMATVVELTIRLGVLGLLLYWSFFLIRPFITIAIWSVVLTVALYPVYDWIVARLGGRRRLAAALLTLINLLIVIGPATWLALGLIDSLRTLSDRLEAAAAVPVCRSGAGRRQADGSRSDGVMSAVVDSGRESRHGNLDANDPERSSARIRV